MDEEPEHGEYEPQTLNIEVADVPGVLNEVSGQEPFILLLHFLDPSRYNIM